jgi:excisionase family DNA binding protein
MSLDDYPDPMKPVEVAKALRIGRSTVFDLCQQGLIRHLRIGKGQRSRVLIYKSDLIDWVEANKR